jgi:hypothetical protein
MASKHPQLKKAQLVKAAKMRDDGATWNQIREYIGHYVASGTFQKLWEQENIPHRASNPQPQRMATLAKKRQEREATEASERVEADAKPVKASKTAKVTS